MVYISLNNRRENVFTTNYDSKGGVETLCVAVGNLSFPYTYMGESLNLDCLSPLLLEAKVVEEKKQDDPLI